LASQIVGEPRKPAFRIAYPKRLRGEECLLPQKGGAYADPAGNLSRGISPPELAARRQVGLAQQGARKKCLRSMAMSASPRSRGTSGPMDAVCSRAMKR
jgi:hypothetical protein